MSGKPVLYEFEGSCWANVPKIALTETGYKKDDVERKEIVLVKGENFEPDYLRINRNGTVPTLVWDGKTYTDSVDIVREIVKRAPHPPKSHAHSSTSIIEEIHGESHDPNASLLICRDEEDRQEKLKGIPPVFLAGRQKALDRIIPNAPEEFKAWLEKKQKTNKELLDFYKGDPDEQTKEAHFEKGKEIWKSIGIVVRGVITQALQKTSGPFAEGEEPGEADYHIITWLARQFSNVGSEPGEPSEKALARLQKATGGHNFDPVIGKYWDAWTKRESFYGNGVH